LASLPPWPPGGSTGGPRTIPRMQPLRRDGCRLVRAMACGRTCPRSDRYAPPLLPQDVSPGSNAFLDIVQGPLVCGYGWRYIQPVRDRLVAAFEGGEFQLPPSTF